MDFAFVLVRPQFAGNVGSVARVLANFGFADLRLVDPQANYLNAEAQKMAIQAFPLLEASKLYASLEDALADIELAIGTTSGRQREFEPVAIETGLEKIITKTGPAKIAWVFGEERNGLAYDEMARCHKLISIGTTSDFPAMNLAQAVGIAAYETSKMINGKGNESAVVEPHSNGKKDDELFELVEKWLEQIGFLRSYNHKQILQELRRTYQRLEPTSRETDLLHGAICLTMKLISANQPSE